MEAPNQMDTEGRLVWSGSSSLGFFKRYDGPYIPETITLSNHALRKIIERHFEYMSRNLFFISAFGRFLLGFEREDAVVQAEDIATATLTKAIRSVSRRIEQAEAAIAAAGIDCVTLYGKKKSFDLPITTPGAKLYAELLTKADHFYSLNSLLWLHGEIDNKAKFSNESETRKEITAVVRGVGSQFGFILNKTRERDEVEASRAGSHDENKLIDQAVEDVSIASAQSMTDNVAATV